MYKISHSLKLLTHQYLCKCSPSDSNIFECINITYPKGDSAKYNRFTWNNLYAAVIGFWIMTCKARGKAIMRTLHINIRQTHIKMKYTLRTCCHSTLIKLTGAKKKFTHQAFSKGGEIIHKLRWIKKLRNNMFTF